MPFDTSMYRTQPVNVLDVIGGYQNIDLRNQQKQANALAFQQHSMEMQKAQQAQQQQADIQNILATAGGSRETAIKALEAKGYYAPADVIRKAATADAHQLAQTEEVRAKAEKEREARLKERLGLYREQLSALGNAPTKDQVVQWVAAQYQDPVTKDFATQAAPFEKFIQSIPDNPSDWVQMVGMGIDKYVQNKTAIRGQDLTAQTSRENNAATNQRMAAEGAANRSVQMRGQNMVDARQRELTQVTKEDKEAARAIEKKDRAVTDYSKTLQKEGIPDFEEALATLEEKLSSYKPGQAPGVGRGAGLIPDFLQGQEAEDLTNSIVAVKNTLLKARSGSAVSESELKRLVQELGTGGFRSEETVRNAVKSIRNRFEKVKANAVAGVSDEVKSEYESRGGVPITRGGAKAETGAFSDAEKERRYQEWKAKQK